jgi:hypothetical protein
MGMFQIGDENGNPFSIEFIPPRVPPNHAIA